MNKFDDIRPYVDAEVISTLENIIADKEFISAIANFKLARFPEKIRPIFYPIFRYAIRKQVKGVNTVDDFQRRVVHYVEHMIKTTMTGFTVSGLDQLDKKQAYLFVSNHRDITLDPTFVNYSRFLYGSETVRIAVGDNLLSKQFISHLIRINKSFVVRRSEKAPRKLFEALKTLSEYIHHSLLVDGQSVWIAQREGRAKDGLDKTDPTIIKMFAISGRKLDFSEYIQSLKIVPVSISYEYDPCDLLKARELYSMETQGEYIKSPHEDISSIAAGISGYKGRVHLSFGDCATDKFETPEQVSDWLDQQIISLYVLHPTNFFAYYELYGSYPELTYSDKHVRFDINTMSQEKAMFDQRIQAMPTEVRRYALNAYANPILQKLALQ